ncbi:alanine racemase [Microbacterium sp.]|uniref:alanine racemase n=1 Tax=Microbacterium sp. TaxID=51671 RepID=UPI003A8AD517
MWGQRREDVLHRRPALGEFATPLLTLDRTALAHNTAVMSEWARSQGVLLAPHGKTTMAPALWRQLLDAGAWGLTLATVWQAQVARASGVVRILIANAVVDPIGLAWLSRELDAHPEVEIIVWADAPATVVLMEGVLTDIGARRPLAVIAELGAHGGRTGARGQERATALAAQISASPRLRLAGVGGYEGALAHDRSPASLARVDAYLDEMVGLHNEVSARGLYHAHPIVTAGGSAYFDRVSDRLVGSVGTATVLVRAGAFQVHDDGFYAGIGPLGRTVPGLALRSAMHAWVRVVSAPESRLRLFDAGKRDLPFDEGLPVVQGVRGLSAAETRNALGDSRVSALNDQHGFLQLGAGADAGALPVGSVIRLGLSHPCTALDKWRLIPVLDDAHVDDPRVVDFVDTFF